MPERGGAVRGVDDREAPAGPMRVPYDPRETLELRRRLRALRLVGRGEVGVDALPFDIGQPARRLEERAGLMRQQAQPVHAGVDLQMQRRRAAKLTRGP